MTKKEFSEYERICKEAWKELSEGANSKPRRLRRFENHCPACEIATKVSDEFDLNCHFCPIDLWREFANSIGDEAEGMAVCQDFGEVSLYADWMNGDSLFSQEAARKISELKWSWLPEYKKVKSVLEKYYEDIEAGL